MAEPTHVDVQSPHGELRTAFYNPYEIKRRRRTSKSQFRTLEKAFMENSKPNASTRRHLAQSLSMTPKGIQIWFQNRRAKNKQTSNNNTTTTTTTTPTAITKNSNDINTTLDNVICKVRSNASHGDEATPTTAGLLSASRHSGQLESDYKLNDISSNNNVPALELRNAMPGTSSNEMSIAPAASPNTPVDNPPGTSSSWCHYKDWNNIFHSTTPPPPHLSHLTTLSMPSLQQSQTGRVMSPQIQQNDVASVCTTKDDASPSISFLNNQGNAQPQQEFLYNNSATNRRRPSTLSLMRRMSMPATINGINLYGTEINTWNNAHPHPSPELSQHPDQVVDLLQTSIVPTSVSFSTDITDTTATYRPRTATNPVQFPSEQKANMKDSRARIRAFPLFRRVSIHETGHHNSLKTRNFQPSEASSLATAAAARRRRRSSINRLNHPVIPGSTPSDSSHPNDMLRAISQGQMALLSPGIPFPSDNVSAPILQASSTLNGVANPLGDNAVVGSSKKSIVSRTYEPTDNAMWIDDVNIHPTLNQSDNSTAVNSQYPLVNHAKDFVVKSFQSLNTQDSVTFPTVATGQAGLPVATSDAKMKERRRSSLKTSKSGLQSGMRVQFDMQKLGSETTWNSRDSSGGDSPMQYLQVTTTGRWPDGFLSNNLNNLTSTAVSNPTSHVEGPAQTSPLATNSGQSCMDSPRCPSTDNQDSFDPQNSRRNSCPPGFIEYFQKGLQINTELSSSPLSLSPVTMFHNILPHQHESVQCQGQIQKFLQEQQQHQSLQVDHIIQQQLPQSFLHLSRHFPHTSVSGAHLAAQEAPPLFDTPLLNNARPEHLLNCIGQQQQHQYQQGEASFLVNGAISLLNHSSSLAGPSYDSTIAKHEAETGEVDPQVAQKALHSEPGLRHPFSDPYRLPQLQTPRMLAQLQHQIEKHPWSRTHSVPQTTGPRPSLSTSLQNPMGRRYSEPGNIPKAVPDDVDLGNTDASLVLDPIVQPRQYLQDPLPGPKEYGPDSMLRMKALKPTNPTALHPLDVSTPSVGLVDSPSPMSKSAFGTPSYITTSFAAPVAPFFASLSGTTASPVSLSPLSSPSSSPLVGREWSNGFSPTHTESPLTDYGSFAFDLTNQRWGPSPSSNLIMVPGPQMKTPLLIRTQSQGSLVLQSNPRDGSTICAGILHQDSAPRRHSQCPDLTPTSSTATGLLSQSPQRDWQQQQQQQQQSVYPLSSYSPLSTDALESQHQGSSYPPSSNNIQSTSSMISHPGTHQLNNQGPLARRFVNGGTDQDINFEQSIVTTDHFSMLQQKLPQTQSGSLPAQHEQTAEQILHTLQQQTPPRYEQLNHQEEQLHPLDRELTLADFNDARVYEEYKHQKFVLEHKRLQQHQEQEMQVQCQRQ